MSETMSNGTNQIPLSEAIRRAHSAMIAWNDACDLPPEARRAKALQAIFAVVAALSRTNPGLPGDATSADEFRSLDAALNLIHEVEGDAVFAEAIRKVMPRLLQDIQRQLDAQATEPGPGAVHAPNQTAAGEATAS